MSIIIPPDKGGQLPEMACAANNKRAVTANPTAIVRLRMMLLLLCGLMLFYS